MRIATIAAAGLLSCGLLIGQAQAQAARHYDCSKPGNANKAACKGAAAAAASPAASAPAPTTAAPAAKPSILSRLRGHKAATAPAAPASPAAPQAPAPQASASAAPAESYRGKSITADPAGATGQCRDGSYTHATHHSGACSSHGGVAKWL